MKNIYSGAYRFLIIVAGCIFSANISFSQWTQTNGPSGITVLSFFDNGTYLFAGTDSKGVFRSDDHGQSWNAANGNIPNLEVFSFAEDASYLYAGSDSGVYRSSDNGLTWEPANNGIQSNFANCLVVADGYLFMGTIAFGVFRSADHGDTWVDASGGSLGFSSIQDICYAAGKLIVAADNLVFYSTDDGDNWYYDYGPEQYYFINDFYTSGDTVMAVTGGGFFPSATVFVSTDGINSWSGPITVDTTISASGIAHAGNIFYVGSAKGIYSSTDVGQSWQYIPASGLRFGLRLQNAFIHSGNNFLLGYEEIGVYSSETGAVWVESKNGFPPASTIDNCMITAGSDMWSGTHSDGVYVSSNGGTTWNHSGATNITIDTFPNSIIKSMLYAGNNILLAGGCGDGNGLWRSADYGATWTHITNGINPNFGNYLCVSSLAKSGNNLLAATYSGMYYSTDDGLTWQACFGVNSNDYVEGIAVHGNVVCICVTELYGNSGVYRSTDNGVHFTFTDGTVSDGVAMDADDAGNFYAGSLFDVYRSTDDGISWSVAENGIPPQSGGFAIKAINQNVFVGNIAGVFYSDNSGASFTAASEGLDAKPNNSVQGFTVKGDTLFTGLFRDAIWKRALSDFGIATAVNQIPAGDENDFRITYSSSQTISYQIHLTSAADAQLQLVDALGRIREKISSGNLSRGTHTGTLDVTDLPPGIYFLEIFTSTLTEKAGAFVKTVKWVKMQ
ncbi:MAG TPA: T9SS type A sorting domain-containing protein [Chitinophagales bacterium]|nr:T9SS type A sorting domain-containing protein [Chitinophagales bacterium]